MPPGTPEGGQWGSGEGGGGDIARPFAVAQNDEPRISVNLRDHEGEIGGHAIRKHVGLDEMDLRGELDGTVVRFRSANLEVVHFQDAWGSFRHITDANNYVSDVLTANSETVRAVASGQVPRAYLDKRYGSPTGVEAYRESAYDAPILRPTYEVLVQIQHRPDLKSGYIIKTAYPFNRRSGQ